MTSKDLKEERVEFRTTKREAELLDAAALVTGRTRTDLVRAAGLAYAQEVLADRTRFTLDEAAWSQFVAALDAPPVKNDALAKLFEDTDQLPAE